MKTPQQYIHLGHNMPYATLEQFAYFYSILYAQTARNLERTTGVEVPKKPAEYSALMSVMILAATRLAGSFAIANLGGNSPSRPMIIFFLAQT